MNSTTLRMGTACEEVVKVRICEPCSCLSFQHPGQGIKVFNYFRLGLTPVASMGATSVNEDEVLANRALAENLAKLVSGKTAAV